MKQPYRLFSVLLASVTGSSADTSWISTSSSVYTTAGNWSNGLPSTGPQLAIFADSATVQHAINITGVTARNTLGIRFDAFGAGGAGFTFGSSTNDSPGFQNRALLAGASVINNDDNAQTFNVPMRMFSNTGVANAAAAQIWSAAAGDLVFSGIYGVAQATVALNGGTLTIDGGFNTTIGSPTGRGDIVPGTFAGGGLTKTGTGTLTLGGTVANTYTGATTISGGTVVAGKVDALGLGSALTLNAATLSIGSNHQTVGAAVIAGGTLNGVATLTATSFDLRSGTINAGLGGGGGILKSTGGTVVLNGSASVAGIVRIDDGTLQLGASDRLSAASPLVLDGGTLDSGGFNQTMATIDLDSPTTIDFGAGASTLTFGDSDGIDWNGAQLDIVNWTAGSDAFRVGTDGSGFDTQLSLIRFADLGNVGAQIDSNGFITPIPEPGNLVAVAALSGLMARRRRR